MISEIRKIRLPAHHDVQQKDVDLRRLGTILALSKELPIQDFESLLLLQGLGPRTLQSLTLVSEVIHGTPSRFNDPARFSFAHGGKDGHPFPVPTKIYDESIQVLRSAIDHAKMDYSDKLKAIKDLSVASKKMEVDFRNNGNLKKVMDHERKHSHQYGGRTVKDWVPAPQMRLFD